MLEEQNASRQPIRAGARSHRCERAETSRVWYSLFLQSNLSFLFPPRSAMKTVGCNFSAFSERLFID